MQRLTSAIGRPLSINSVYPPASPSDRHSEVGVITQSLVNCSMTSGAATSYDLRYRQIIVSLHPTCAPFPRTLERSIDAWWYAMLLTKNCSP